MLEKPLTSLFGLGLLMMVAWVLVASTPQLRMERTCRPIPWLGNVLVSLAALTTDDTPQAVAPQDPSRPRDVIRDGPAPSTPAGAKPVTMPVRVRAWVDSVNYGCQYTLWRLFYEDDYRKAMAAEQQRQLEEAQREAAKSVAKMPSSSVKPKEGRSVAPSAGLPAVTAQLPSY